MDRVTQGLQQHFGGVLSDVTVPGPDQGPAVAEVDLRAMAGRAMHWALYNPQPAFDYACRFSISLGAIPPAPIGVEAVAVGDTDIRLQSALAGLREMSGRQDRLDVDEGLRRRVRSYLGEDNLCRSAFAVCCVSDPAIPPDTPVVSPWTTGFLLRSLTDDYARTGEPALRDQARGMWHALRGLAHWQGERAWYPSGCGVLLDGRPLVNWTSENYPSITCDVAHFAEVTGDEEALGFAHSFARGLVAGLQESLGPQRVGEEGSFGGHVHLHTRCFWGVAQVGRLTGDADLLAWARRAYEFVRSRGTDFGWFPELVVLPCDRPDWAETCCTGDMVQIATQLALAGHEEYWDHVERYVGNYLAEIQWDLTPEWEAWFRQEHATQPAELVEQALAQSRDFQGGWDGLLLLEDWDRRHQGYVVGQAGCCQPEAMRALHTAWRETVVTDPAGVTHVRMGFARRTEAAVVEPIRGGVRVQMRRDGDLAVRPPAWADPDGVRVAVAGEAALSPTPDQWQGAEVLLRGLRRGEPVTMTWPEPVFTQRREVGGRIGAQRPLSVVWRGNRLLSVGRPGE